MSIEPNSIASLLAYVSQAIPNAHLYCQPPGTVQAYLKGFKLAFLRAYGQGTPIRAEVHEGSQDIKNVTTTLLAHDDDLAGWLSVIVKAYNLDTRAEPLIEGHARSTALTGLTKTQAVVWDALTRDEPLSVRDKESRLYLRAERGSNVLTLTDYYGGDAGPAIWTIAFVRPYPSEASQPIGLVQNGLRAKPKDLERHLEFLAGFVDMTT